LPAGWVHFVFSTLQTTVLGAFVFCRQHKSAELSIATLFAAAYFVAMGFCGYLMHHALIISDVFAWGSGLFLVIAYPRLIDWSKRKRANPSVL
jgi:hypothetical protein